MDIEFKIGDTVTLDRYNHIDDVQKVKIIRYSKSFIGGYHQYDMDVNGVIISASGKCIMESKYYDPVDNEDRHYKEGSTPEEIEKYWKLKNMKP